MAVMALGPSYLLPITYYQYDQIKIIPFNDPSAGHRLFKKRRHRDLQRLLYTVSRASSSTRAQHAYIVTHRPD